MIPAEILLKAYTTGIFPMSEGKNGCIKWYTANPRGVLDPQEFHYSKRLERTYNSGKFIIRFNFDFEGVIRGCADAPREGTWISEEIIESYVNLHRLRYAHSVESYNRSTNSLVGGLYGVSLGGMFFGESMFHLETDASKVALIALVEHLRKRKFVMIDMQMLTNHMKQFGGKLIAKDEYMRILVYGLKKDCKFL